ncbi:hypothetical protein FEZ18_14075 [Oceanihabitans sp. IOP_32]|uniref:hypothetical protein n=1 Tax=Oceanihabitans sp. IOP_32 TaxID=2529032 RepID=UPI0012930475|nr:hypothetical protein [Oceanihabitans sp. IOP_32]QFZ55849.1 hypothetical protein FEZ18_14075 [Oceanihabitans sp. IOP_32]
MDIGTIKLLFDFGLFVLIWMVQLVVYPSFLYYQKNDLIKWHKWYTKGLSAIVIPLMIGQLITAITQLIEHMALETVVSLLLIILVWIATFTQFVPIHYKITNKEATDQLLKQLVNKNWLRTLLWTFILIWNLYFNWN